jgi:dynein heavy chain
LVLAEKLFDLPISTFPELVSIDEENKFLQPLYDLYRDVKGIIKDYSSTLWMKLDAEQLQKAIDKLYNHMRRKLAQKYSNEHPVYRQLN